MRAMDPLDACGAVKPPQLIEPPDAMVARMAADHVVTRDALLAAGLTPSMIRTRLERGSLHPLHRGVYAVGCADPGRRGRWRAGTLATAPSWLAARSAGALWQLPVEEGPSVEVVVASPNPRRIVGVRVRRCPTLDIARDTTVRAGIPVTTLPRTLVDLCDVVDDRAARACVDAGVIRYGLSRDALAAVLARCPGRVAHAVLGPLVAVEGDLTRSELERHYLSVLRGRGVPEPVVNVRDGRTTPDCAWPRYGLVVEIDSYRWHSSRARQHADATRDAHHAVAGRRVLRFVTGQVRGDPQLVVAATLAALRERGWRG